MIKLIIKLHACHLCLVVELDSWMKQKKPQAAVELTCLSDTSHSYLHHHPASSLIHPLPED